MTQVVESTTSCSAAPQGGGGGGGDTDNHAAPGIESNCHNKKPMPSSHSSNGNGEALQLPSSSTKPEGTALQQELNAIIGKKREKDGSQASSPSSSASSTPTAAQMMLPNLPASSNSSSSSTTTSGSKESQALPPAPNQTNNNNHAGNQVTVMSAPNSFGGKGTIQSIAAATRSTHSSTNNKTATRGQMSTRGAAGISKTIEEACHAAAVEDGVLSPPGGRGGGTSSSASVVSSNEGAGSSSGKPPTKQKNGLRRGKWTPEEEAYANRLIVEFKSGLLPLTDGTTLRTFLSKLLNCDPMRISKKFVGQNCIGKQVFRRRQQAEMDRLSAEDIERSRQELAELERKFLERVAQTNRCKNSVGGSKHGKDSGMGQVAPDIPRRQQEYITPQGQALPGPILPPWMLPPETNMASAAAGKAAAGAASSASSWAGENNNAARPPQYPSTGRLSTLSQNLRRSPPVQTTDPIIPRTDSQDSLAAMGGSLATDAAMNLTELIPRNTSLGDLTSLNMFTNSPFPSTDNLVGLIHIGSNASPARNEWTGSERGSSSNVVVKAEPLTSSSSVLASSSNSNSSRRMTRVESATGLSSLRVMSGLPRNTSVEDFLSLVACGDIPAPEQDMLSTSIFQSHLPQARGAQQSAVAFTGIGKSSAVSGAGSKNKRPRGSTDESSSGRGKNKQVEK